MSPITGNAHQYIACIVQIMRKEKFKQHNEFILPSSKIENRKEMVDSVKTFFLNPVLLIYTGKLKIWFFQHMQKTNF